MSKLLWKTVVCFVCAVAVTADNATVFKLPKGFVQCRIADSNFNECLRTGVQNAIPYLSKGVPGLGLLKLDPLRLSTLEIGKSTAVVTYRLKFIDLDILNLRSLLIKNATYNPADYTISAVAEARKPIVLDGKYDLNGKVLIVPLTGNGACNVILNDFKLSGHMNLKPVVRGEKTYLKLKNLSLTFTTSELHIRLDNLFDGNQVLGDHMNDHMNRNARRLLSEVQSSLENSLSTAFVPMIQQFFNHVPLDEIFVL